VKFSIRALKGDISRYKELLEKKFNYDKHYNVYKRLWLNNFEYKLDELKDVEVKTVEELFNTFKEFEGFSYDDCQIAIDVNENIIYIFDRYVE
jgi:hypothetical protein